MGASSLRHFEMKQMAKSARAKILMKTMVGDGDAKRFSKMVKFSFLRVCVRECVGVAGGVRGAGGC